MKNERGQSILEYSVILAIILIVVVGAIRLVGTNANSAFSQVNSAMTQ